MSVIPNFQFSPSVLKMPGTRASARIKSNNSAAPIAPAPKRATAHKKTKYQDVSHADDSATEKDEKPQFISDMPLDVLCEIFIYLQPGDILRLSQSSKAVRAIVMSPHAQHIWKSVSPNRTCNSYIVPMLSLPGF